VIPWWLSWCMWYSIALASLVAILLALASFV
jgi:hypothetical protein